ncbi:MAG: aspartate aminotransferase family protein [Candidatus Bathyarchaeota archaeon]|nr:aspartate aminotransferase family protein [Candidatus Bathyarchaeota archaeon]
MKQSGPKIVAGPPGPKVSEALHDAGLSDADYGSPLVEQAEGIYIKDPDGNVFIDLVSGRCVANTGHRHPRVVKAIRDQLDHGFHWQNLEMYRLQDRLGYLTGLSPCQIFWSQSGSMVNDFAIKAARRITGRPGIISFTGSYHGSSMGGISLSGYDPSMKRHYGPLIPEIHHVPYAACYRCPFKKEPDSCGFACLDYLEDVVFKSYVVPDETAAVFVEPIQGDAGWHIPPPGWHQRLRSICDEHGMLLVVDEVQTAFGRTGKWMSMEHWGVQGDIVLLGKAMASGVPISACVLPRTLLESTDPEPIPIHAQSFSATPLGVAAAHATIDVIKDEKLCENSEKTGAYMKKRLVELMDTQSCIGDIRGLGFLLGVEIVKDRDAKTPAPELAGLICREAFKRGLFILNMGSYGGRAIRVAPPLIITPEQVDTAVEVLDESMKATTG